MARAAAWVGAGALTAGLAWASGKAGLPSPSLFAALLVGLAIALTAPERLAVGRAPFVAAQAVTGVLLGTYLRSSSLTALGDAWLPVTIVSLATLAFCLAAGVALARFTELDPPTAALGSVAGGASGIVTMAEDLGADDRLVAFMQYARVLVVVLITPLLSAVAFPGHNAGLVAIGCGPYLGTVAGWPLTFAVAAVGGILGLRVRLPAAVLLGPMILSGVLTLAWPGLGVAVPPIARDVGFALIGLQVGLKFTVETIRQVGRLLIPVLVSIVALLIGCFGLALVLHWTASVSLLDGYLATTPGGLYAVLAIAVGAGSDTTFVVAVQGLRLLVMVLLAPVAVRWLLRSRAARSASR
ncbi:MAG: rane protein AbrB duplication [Solirubrobacteraceae bacterium]|nr:rane protein AbrB duplication [Solirubrobacteraceae bacterium]